MSQGAYFVIGDIKGGHKFKRNLAAIFNLHGAPEPKVLYLGAACDNKLKSKTDFEKGLSGINPKIEMQFLNLAEHTPLTNKHARPDYIEKRMSEADIIFFDGGGIAPLAATFERFDIANYIKAAVDRGAYAGGLCAGGSFMASRVVFCEREQVQTCDGAGLIADTAISCHMSDSDEKLKAYIPARLELLRREASRNTINHAIGLGHNHAVLFQNGAAVRLPPLGADTTAPFTIDRHGGRLLLPSLS